MLLRPAQDAAPPRCMQPAAADCCPAMQCEQCCSYKPWSGRIPQYWSSLGWPPRHGLVHRPLHLQDHLSHCSAHLLCTCCPAFNNVGSVLLHLLACQFSLQRPSSAPAGPSHDTQYTGPCRTTSHIAAPTSLHPLGCLYNLQSAGRAPTRLPSQAPAQDCSTSEQGREQCRSRGQSSHCSQSTDCNGHLHLSQNTQLPSTRCDIGVQAQRATIAPREGMLLFRSEIAKAIIWKDKACLFHAK